MGYEQLKNISDENRKELEKTRLEEDNPISICPECGFNLMVNAENQKACLMCGAIWR